MTQPQRTIQQIEQLLPQLQSRQLEMVLAFTEFVRSRAMAQNEDDVLWSFVEREQAYRAAHPEDVLVFDSDEELFAALDAIQ
jgi:hypothetical protein